VAGWLCRAVVDADPVPQSWVKAMTSSLWNETIVGGTGADVSSETPDRLAEKSESEEGSNASIGCARNLTVEFQLPTGQRVPAVRDVSLDIHGGEILALVGESGSGKTTLGLSIMGMLPRDPAPALGGAVEILGLDMLHAPARERRELLRRSLGVVFQDSLTSLNPTTRIGQQVKEVAGSTSETVRLLQAVGVADAGDRLRSFPHEMSGGQRQRVMLAIAIAGTPSLVLADEPTTALDVTVQAQVLALIGRLRREMGCAFLLITHDLGVAAQVADRIAVLYAGKLVEIGTATEVLTNPAHPYTIALLMSRLTMDSDRSRPLWTLLGEPPDPSRPTSGCPFAPRCSFGTQECEQIVPELLPSGRPLGRAACIRVDEVTRIARAPVVLPEWPSSGSEERRPIAKLRGVRVTFVVRSGLRAGQHLHALRGIDLDVRQGECVALVGESGCGKSTLLRSIAGLVRMDDGESQLAVDCHPQMVFQDAGSSLTAWLTVQEQVEERLRAEGIPKRVWRDRVSEVLRLVGLQPDVALAKPSQLSGGQCQRVVLARAVVIPPGLLLCDEPTSSLDVSLAATVLNLIGSLRRTLGLSVLFVTHDLAAARVIADRIVVMYLGQVVEAGPAEEVASEPAHPYTKLLLSAVAGTRRKPVPILGEPASPISPPSGCSFHPRCPEAISSCALEPPVLVSFGVAGNREAACCACARSH
jgi:peptide/nickel transport system ATP-binding protein